MLARLFARRLGPAWIALTAYDVWRRLPPAYRRRLLEESRRHAPAVAAQGRLLLHRGLQAQASRRAARRRRRP